MAEIVMTDNGCRCTGCLEEYKFDLPMSIEKFNEVVENIVSQHLQCKKQMKMFDKEYIDESELDFLIRLLGEEITSSQERIILERIQILKHRK